MTSRYAAKLVTLAAVVALCVGCAGSYRSTTVNGHTKMYRTDDAGEKHLVYETFADGSAKVYDESDPQAQEVLWEQKKREKLAEAEEVRLENIRTAPKRAETDPIVVRLHDGTIGERLAEEVTSREDVQEQFRREFESDPVLRLGVRQKPKGPSDLENALKGLSIILQGDPDAMQFDAASSAPIADVEVFPYAHLEGAVFENKQSGDLSLGYKLVFEARVVSNYLPSEHKVMSEGNPFANQQITRDLAEQVKQVIKETIGPEIPADRSL